MTFSVQSEVGQLRQARRWSAPLRELFDDLDGPRLAEYLVGGVLKADLRPRHAKSLKWDMLAADDFLLPPLPNHLFTRDNSAWVYGGVSMNPMAKPARQREHLHIRAVYTYHPMFARTSGPQNASSGTTGQTTWPSPPG